jgi:hypothetical protein
MQVVGRSGILSHLAGIFTLLELGRSVSKTVLGSNGIFSWAGDMHRFRGNWILLVRECGPGGMEGNTMGSPIRGCGLGDLLEVTREYDDLH